MRLCLSRFFFLLSFNREEDVEDINDCFGNLVWASMYMKQVVKNYCDLSALQINSHQIP